MKDAMYHMLYLTACVMNNIVPARARVEAMDREKLYQVCQMHLLTALVAVALESAGVNLEPEWKEAKAKAMRKELLFDAERTKILHFMEGRGIWYLTLKGIPLKNYYPKLGMRQMSDNDILYDKSFCDEVQIYMESEGYKAISVGVGNHDVYKKEPVYNFELHRALYGELHQDGWAEYYENVKDRLILNEGTSYGYHFTDEDFYVYITTHAYKHYAGDGTGLRTLLDFYVYLNAKPQMNYSYIEKECELLGIAEFEKRNRILCRKVFEVSALNGWESLEQSLSEDEKEMLSFYLYSGVYGTMERNAENRIRKYREKSGSNSKQRYLLSRVFATREIYRNWPFFEKHKWLLPIAWFYRLIRPVFDKKRRMKLIHEIKVLKRI